MFTYVSTKTTLCCSVLCYIYFFFFFSSRRRHTRFDCDWSSDVCSSDLDGTPRLENQRVEAFFGELFRGPAAGDSGANNDRVIDCSRHGFPLRISRPGAKRRAAMLRTGDDFELQFLRKTDFRCVVAVKSQVFEYRKEIALHLPVAAFGFPGGRRLLLQGAGVGGRFVHSA